MKPEQIMISVETTNPKSHVCITANIATIRICIFFSTKFFLNLQNMLI